MKEQCTEKNTPTNYNRIFPSTMSTSGFIRLYILFLLSKKTSSYGKELIDEIENRFGARWRPSHGMMYPILRDMENDNLIIGEWEDPIKKTKKFYKITELGYQTLQQELINKENMFIDSYNIINKIMADLYKSTRPAMLNVRRLAALK